MGADIALDLGSLLPFLEDKIRAVVGYDHASLEFRALIDKHLARAVSDAATVQVIGMERPISIFKIYQPTSLRQTTRTTTVSAFELIDRNENAIIFAGPGRGKTILLRYLFATLAQSKEVAPLLFTLRWTNAAAELAALVDHLTRGKAVKRDRKLVLLIDGLDEIPPNDRSKVLESLTEFISLDRGTFLLTCRSFYTVAEIKASRFFLASFSDADTAGFMRAFAEAYGADFDVERLLIELKERAFDDFLDHPLMLALICILKAGPEKFIPRTPILLIRAAIETLTHRWDASRGIQRSSEVQVTGRGRVDCLKSIAFGMRDTVARTIDVERLTTEFLSSSSWSSVDPSVLLEEMAQWYGLLVPITDDQTSFVHRTIHDYLSACHWHASGQFKPEEVRSWNAEAGFVACLAPDATESILASFNTTDNIETLVMCLENRAVFDEERVARMAVRQVFRTTYSNVFRAQRGVITVQTENDFFGVASNKFLSALVDAASSSRTDSNDVVVGYALAELFMRSVTLPSEQIQRLTRVYGADTCFMVNRSGTLVSLSLPDMTGPKTGA